jgi:hypothetical protein
MGSTVPEDLMPHAVRILVFKLFTGRQHFGKFLREGKEVRVFRVDTPPEEIINRVCLVKDSSRHK